MKKRFLSMVLAIAMMAVSAFTFSAPASATDAVYQINDSYVELYFDTYGSEVTEFTFTVPRSGYYIIQTFGYFDVQWGQMNSEVLAELLDSSNLCTREIAGGSGYNNGLFFSEYLYENETYTLRLTFNAAVWHYRLSITNAADYFWTDNSHDYYDLITQIDVGWNGSDTVYCEFENEGEQKALVYRALYGKQGNSGSRYYIISANCCSCTQIVLVSPCGHPFISYGGSQVSFDMRKPMSGSSLGGIVQEEVPLEEDLPYYLVIYRSGYEGNCPDHDEYTGVTFAFEPADLQ